MKELTKEQFEAVKEGYPFDGSDEYIDWQYEEIDSWPIKYQMSGHQFVFCDPTTNKYYMGSYSRDYEWGIDSYEFPIQLDEVKQVEVVIHEWQKVTP